LVMQQIPAVKEFYLKIENHPHLMGRITLVPIKKQLNVEIEIVHRETKKIWAPVDILYGLSTVEDALSSGVQRLAHYLQEEAGNKGKTL
jgi:hypothetical protein